MKAQLSPKPLPRLVLLLLMASSLYADAAVLSLTLRSQKKNQDSANYVVQETKAAWDPKQTAIIICDMWDDHWCRSAGRRVGELARPLNEVIKQARARGVFIIHSPSSVVDFYKGTPQRQRAQQAPF